MNIRLKILIVEDNEGCATVNKVLVATLLARFPGSEVAVVKRLDDALRVIDEMPHPDVILLDLTLEDAGADKVEAEIQAMDAKSPVVVISGNLSEDRIQRIRAKGIEYFTKPITSIDKFLAGVARALLRGEERLQARATQRFADMRRVLDQLHPNVSKEL